MKKTFCLTALLFVVLMIPLHLMAVSTYLNEYNVPVGINVPYYPEGSLIPKHIDIVLQPGDLYKGNIGRNGFIYEQYGSMPGIAESLIDKNTNSAVVCSFDRSAIFSEEYDKFVNGLTSTNMPDWWISQYITEKQIDKLNDPCFDVDSDGYDNRMEFLSGSNPLQKNDLIAYPKYIKMIPEGCAMVTGIFHIINHSKSNLFFKFENPLIRSNDNRYRPHLFDKEGKSADAGIEVSAKSTNDVYCLVKEEFFPKFFDEDYQIFISVTNNSIGIIKFYTPGNYSHSLTKPTNLTPKAGSCIEPGEKLRCSWSDEGNRDIQWYQIVNKYQLQVIGLNNIFPKTTYIKEEKPIVLMDKRDWIYNRPEPGNYVWRVNKQNQYSDPISSDWSWFNIGREVAPQKAKGRGSDQAHVEGHNGADVIFAVVGKEYDLPIDKKSSLNSHFLEPLLKNQEVYYQTNGAYHLNCFRVRGVFEKAGLYTNTWFNISREGETNKSLYIFVVRNPSAEKNVRSFYYLEDKTITHDLFVNVPFDYKERKFYETFSKKDDMSWDDDLKIEFSEALPKGLSVKRTEEGDDLEIKGVPLEGGVFKLDLVFSKAGNQVKEKHVFRIKDIGEPAFGIENKLQGLKEKRTAYYIEGTNLIYHVSYVGLNFKYPVYHDAFLRYNGLEKYGSFVENVRIGFIGKLPPGLTVGDIPFCTNKVTKAETIAVGFIGKPAKAGWFTNYVVLAEKDVVNTNKHIFIIKDDLN